MIDLGLTEGQVTVYMSLLTNGPMPVSRLQRETGIARQAIYKILDSLIKIGLTEKQKLKEKHTLFTASHPSTLERLADKKQQESADAIQSFRDVLPKFVSIFNVAYAKPGILILDGVAGLQKLYDDIIKKESNILLIGPSYKVKFEEILGIIERQAKRQAATNIHVRAITPLRETTHEKIKYDQERLIERRFTNKETLNIPAQIIVYGDRVGITTYDNQMITTIIENVAIRDTFVTIFEYIWQTSKNDHEKIVKKLREDGAGI